MNPTRNRSSIIYLLLFVAIIVMVVYQFQQQSTTKEPLTINELATAVQAGTVKRIVEDDNRLRVTMANGDEEESQKETDATLIQQLKELGVSTSALSSDNIKIEVKPPSAWLGIATALGYFIPFILLAGVFWFVFRQAQGSNNAAMSFGKSRARMFSGDHHLLFSSKLLQFLGRTGHGAWGIGHRENLYLPTLSYIDHKIFAYRPHRN